jgi:DNA polymerase-3 subunit epsilon
MRQIVLDTETTGLEVEQFHRVIEIGCVEVFNRRLTGRTFHRYLNPERDIDEGAQAVHGLSREYLSSHPKFAQVHAEFLEFVRDAELIIHNAPFDVAFLNAELTRIESGPRKITEICKILDTLALARQMHPGSTQQLGRPVQALLGGQFASRVSRRVAGRAHSRRGVSHHDRRSGEIHPERRIRTARNRSRQTAPQRVAADVRITVVRASEEELAAHDQVLALLDKSSRGNTVWRKL